MKKELSAAKSKAEEVEKKEQEFAKEKEELMAKVDAAIKEKMKTIADMNKLK